MTIYIFAFRWPENPMLWGYGQACLCILNSQRSLLNCLMNLITDVQNSPDWKNKVYRAKEKSSNWFFLYESNYKTLSPGIRGIERHHWHNRLKNTYICLCDRSSHRCSIKKLVLKISQDSQENTCVGVYFW